MGRRVSVYWCALLLASLTMSRAGDSAPQETVESASTSAATSETAESNWKTTYELNADTSYVGGAHSQLGAGSLGSISENRTDARFVISPQYKDGLIYRLGFNYQRYTFSYSRAAPLPDILQAENLVLGVDFELFGSVLMRAEADPGLYCDARSTRFRNFNVPFSLGGSYIASAELQWIAGIEVNIDRQIPIFPAIGVRWALADNWVIDAILPTPRLEYDWNKALTLYIGADVDDGTYRVDRGVGVALGLPKLSGAVVEYDELRVGAGFSWKAAKGVTLEIESGYLPYREFDYHRANEHFANESGAPYGQLSLNAQF